MKSQILSLPYAAVYNTPAAMKRKEEEMFIDTGNRCV